MLEGKRGLDASASTNLDFILRSKGIGSKGIETVALGGVLTNCCVESTMRSAMRSAYERGAGGGSGQDGSDQDGPAEHDGAGPRRVVVRLPRHDHRDVLALLEVPHGPHP